MLTASALVVATTTDLRTWLLLHSFFVAESVAAFWLAILLFAFTSLLLSSPVRPAARMRSFFWRSFSWVSPSSDRLPNFSYPLLTSFTELFCSIYDLPWQRIWLLSCCRHLRGATHRH